MSRIVATGSYQPKNIVPNSFFTSPPVGSELLPIVKLMTGMRERRHASGDETGAYIGCEAARNALESSEYNAEDVDFIIGCVVPNLYLYPEDLFLVARELGCTNATVLPINTSCTSFLTALQLADTLINNGKKKVALVLSSTVWAMYAFDRSSDYSIAGDGAGAVLLDGRGDCLLAEKQVCDFRVFHTMRAKSPFMTGKQEYFLVTEDPSVDMVEEQVMKPIDVAKQLLDENPTIAPKWFIAHQAGTPMLEVWRRRLKLDKSSVLHTFDRYANMTSSNIPVTLDHYVRNGTINRGDELLLFAPAAGAHYISILWRY